MQTDDSIKLRRVHRDAALYCRLVGQPLERVLAVMADPVKREGLVRRFRETLKGRPMTLGISHGDFSLNNIYIREDDGCGLIDWDDSALEGLSIEDAISHLSSRLVRRAEGFVAALLGLATRDALTAARGRVSAAVLRALRYRFGSASDADTAVLDPH